MASGHVNRINRPNTWLHRPMLRREVLTCQPGAVHTWHLADIVPGLGTSALGVKRTSLIPLVHVRYSPMLSIKALSVAPNGDSVCWRDRRRRTVR